MLFNPSPKQLTLLKVVTFLLALVPFGLLVWRTLDGQFVEPLAAITHGTGDWTLYFLCITLAVTPLRRLMKWNWLIKLRRMLGLFAFFYAMLHFTTYVWFDHFFDIDDIWKDVLKRPFVTVGFAALVLLIPLAATSANSMVRRLGGKRWQWLHRLIYLIAPLGIVHLWWIRAGKHNFSQPITFGAIIGVLLLMRLYWSLTKASANKAKGSGGKPVARSAP